MVNKFEIGQIVDGKVTGIQPYGAFIALDEETQGLIHISEIASSFVTSIEDHVQVGDDITVKVIHIDEKNKHVSLSLRQMQNTSEPKKVKNPENAQGFTILKEKLDDWLQKSENQ